MAIFIFGLPNVSYAENYLPDEPEIGRDESISNQMIDSYAQALGIGKQRKILISGTPEVLHTIGQERFSFLLTEKAGKVISIYEAIRIFYNQSRGLCRPCSFWR